MERQQAIEAILERFESPSHRGTLVIPPARSARGENASCGDVITLNVLVVDGRVSQARWSGIGCTLSQVGADVAAGLAEGRSVADVWSADPEEVLETLGREVVKTRRECATLGARTLRAALSPSLA